MTPTQWANKYLGTAIAVPGMKLDEFGQCLVAMNSYLHDVYGKPYVYTSAAINVWNNSLLDQYGFSKIPAGQPIKAGDFIFYDGRIGSKFGHVSVASRDGTPADFWAWDSNYGGTMFMKSGFPTLHEVHHNDKFNSYIMGYYRIAGGKGAGTTNTNNGEEPMIIQNADNWFGRCNKTMYQIRGRNLSRDEFVKYAVGNEYLRWVESVEDNPEADEATRAQEVGQVAVRDGWEGQVLALQSQLKSVQAQLLALQDKPPEVTKAIKMCNIDTSNMTEDNASTMVKFVVWLQNVLSKK